MPTQHLSKASFFTNKFYLQQTKTIQNPMSTIKSCMYVLKPKKNNQSPRV